MDVLHRLSEVEPLDDGFGFNLIDSEGEPLVRFVYDTEQDARQGAKFMQAAMDRAVGIVPAGPF
jgi:hypothetical protein